MRLQRLTNLELTKLQSEMEELMKTINRLETILSSRKEILDIIRNDLLDLKKKYGDDRRTVINPSEIEIGQEELIPRTKIIVSLTETGYIKRIPVRTYRTQRRGGRGVKGMATKEADRVEHLKITSTLHTLLFFTNTGRVFGLKAYRVPKYDRTARGMPISNLISLGVDERVVALLPVESFDKEGFIFMATSKGTVKKTSLEEFAFIPSTGKIALGLDEGDSLEWVRTTNGNDQVMLATAQGKSIRFKETDVRPMGRTAKGVRGIRLSKKDKVVGLTTVEEGKDVLLVTEGGYGKRTPLDEFTLQNRGGSGLICARVTQKTGQVCEIRTAGENDGILLISEHGIIIRSKVNSISVIGRATQGVKLMNLNEGDRVAACALDVKEEDLEDEEDEEPNGVEEPELNGENQEDEPGSED